MQHGGFTRRGFIGSAGVAAAGAQTVGLAAPAPLFRDPIHDGAADPVIIWNRQEKNWWLLYTQRRANVDGPGVAWCHGGGIGVARSMDAGRTWRYLGILPGLEFERGRNTFWAPEVMWNEGRYHMYCSYVPGVPQDWTGARRIVHYTSPDLWKWTCHGPLQLSSERVIDACVERMPDGHWRMWYKDEAHSSHTYTADSANLYAWTAGPAAITGKGHEGPNVFRWKGSYWLIMDHWDGLGVFRSSDGANWSRQKNDILQKPGARTEDGVKGGHADVLVQGEDAWIFYFTHPQRIAGAQYPAPAWGEEPYALRRTSIQVAKLELDGEELICRRDEPFPFELRPGVDNWGS
jgi:hypothetical protein